MKSFIVYFNDKKYKPVCEYLECLKTASILLNKKSYIDSYFETEFESLNNTNCYIIFFAIEPYNVIEIKINKDDGLTSLTIKWRKSENIEIDFIEYLHAVCEEKKLKGYTIQMKNDYPCEDYIFNISFNENNDVEYIMEILKVMGGYII